MYSHYLQMFLGFILAQALMASIMVYNYQKEKSVAYPDALKSYFKSEVGFFIIGIIGILTVLFILSDFIDLSVTRQDLLSKNALNIKEKLQLYFKTGSILIGGFVQYIAFKARDKGKAAIDKIADKL